MVALAEKRDNEAGAYVIDLRWYRVELLPAAAIAVIMMRYVGRGTEGRDSAARSAN